MRSQPLLNPSLSLLFLSVAFQISLAPAPAADPSPSRILRHFSLYEKRDAYCAWPAIARAANGDLLVLFTRTEEHMSPNGEILLVRSTDNGDTWLPPSVIYDTPIDDRESGVTTLLDGRLLAHFQSVRFTRSTYESMSANSYEKSYIDRWIGYVEKPEYQAAGDLHRAWHSLSDDNGRTWSRPVPGHDSIHGGLQLHNGQFLVASYRTNEGSIGLYRGDAPLGEWTQIGQVDCPRPDRIRFGEPHIIQLASGRIVMMIRATAKPYNDRDPDCKLWGAYSDDNGDTWSEPYETPLWGFPPHLLQLSDERVLCTYGYRRAPFGQRACISEDGIRWSERDEIIIRADAASGDLGYPVSIELEPGKILSVYYQPNLPDGSPPPPRPPDPNRVKPGILGTVWTVPQ